MYHQTNQLKCADCPDSVPLVEHIRAGNLVCTGCGLVIRDREIDVGFEMRSNNTLLNKSRVGEEDVLYDDMSTIIGHTRPSTVAYKETAKQKYRNKRILRSLVTGFKEIAQIAGKLNTIRAAMESGQLIYEKIHTKQSVKCRSKESIAAACLYFACRKNNVPRTFKEICAVTKSSKKDIGKCFKFISNMIEEVLVQTSVVQYLPRFSARLELPTAVEDRARHLVERFESLGILEGRSPATVSALAIMMAIDGLKWNPKGQTGHLFASEYVMKQIVEVTGACVQTIREAQKVVKAHGGEEFAKYFHTEQKIGATKDSSNKFLCKSSGCGKSFPKDSKLARHERIHLGIKPFSCTWTDCRYSAATKESVVVHVRTQHFKLPALKKEQTRRNIEDNRNPEDYVRVDHELLERRLE